MTAPGSARAAVPAERSRADFVVLERIARHAAGLGSDDRIPDPVVLRRRARDTVFEYRLAGLPPLIAKRYADPVGVTFVTRVTQLLEARGFGPTAHERVPAIAASFPDIGVVLMHPADGHALPSHADRPGDWAAGLEAAGRWLARLHAADVRIDRVVGEEAIAARLGERLARAADLRPGSAALLGTLATELGALPSGPPMQQVLTHGRYHAGHVFLGTQAVTVIDLDTMAMADPARDLGEFLARLSMVTRRTRQDERASALAVDAFIRGYHGGGGTVPPSLASHWAGAMAAIVAHLVETDHPRLARRVDHCLRELRTIADRSAALGRDSAAR